MTILSRKHASVLCLLGIVLLVFGCGNEGTESRYGAWTMMEEDVQLTEDLRVSETEAFYFGSISALDVTSDGRMVVADRQANNIKVLRPDGSLLDTLGGPGEGPGEFQMLRSVRVARGDSLYAHDMMRSQTTVFGPPAPYEVNRVISIPREEGLVGTLNVLEDRLVGSFGSGTAPEDGVTRPNPTAKRLLDETGTPGDTLLLDRSQQAAFAFGDGGGFTAELIPFSRKTVLATGPDGRFYHGWTDSLHIEATTLEGTSETIASIPTDPVPVTDAARDSALSDVDDEMRSMVVSALPDTKPAFTDLVVADDGRLWVQRPAEKPDAETVAWWILDPDNKTIQETRLPESVDLEVVQDGNAYGTTTTDAGAPAVVRYNVSSDT
jgi:hypothetical protein